MHEWNQSRYLVSTDNEKFDIQEIHQYLTRSPWAKGI